MPCYEVNKITCEFNLKNKDLIIEALKERGCRFTVLEDKIIINGGIVILDLKNKTAQTTNVNFLNDIKRNYSEKTIALVAKKRKWILEGNKTKFTLTKY